MGTLHRCHEKTTFIPHPLQFPYFSGDADRMPVNSVLFLCVPVAARLLPGSGCNRLFTFANYSHVVHDVA